MVLLKLLVCVLAGCGAKAPPPVDAPGNDTPTNGGTSQISGFRQANEGTLGIRARQTRNPTDKTEVVARMTVEHLERSVGPVPHREVITDAKRILLVRPDRFEYFQEKDDKPDAWKKFKDVVFEDHTAKVCAADDGTCAACDVVLDTDGAPADCATYEFSDTAPSETSDTALVAYTISVIPTRPGIPCKQDGDGQAAGFMVRTRDNSPRTTVWTDHWVLRTTRTADVRWSAYEPPRVCTNDSGGIELRGDKAATIELARLYELVALDTCDGLDGVEAQVCGMCVDGGCAFAQLDWHWYAHKPKAAP